ncbi:MAG: NADH-quinone oxidoreductase subunit L [Parachlamydia sp.]|nr:NADH-quinone oxidoreductase subunit L [Parachlamydia sp.]
MLCTICLGLFLPLAGFLILTASSESISRRWAGLIGCGSVLLAFCCFVSYFFQDLNAHPVNVTLFQWIPVEGIQADFKLHLDHLSLLMTLIITGIGFLIHLYSNGYMEHEEDFARYFAFMNFFVFSMLLLVLAGNLLLLFVGWEGVGLASYLLIGYYYTHPAAAQAATKAFVVNRIGDAGFLLGLLLTFHLFGTSDIEEISSRASQAFAVGAPVITILTLLFFFGATGKSAQIPLHTWLADAMEGPTPVSALIHAATMVTAGVYLVVRLHPLFLLAPLTLQVIGIIGILTAFLASLWALGQTDLKRVLAYSTVSQLGYMFLACGAGAFYSAMFHLTTHAFMKSLLFLSAGNVVHMMHGTTDMRKMGGLAKKFPLTHWLFLIGVLAMSGIPPFAAFFSKDLILEQEHMAGFDKIYYLALATSVITGFYLMRAYCLTFAGKQNLNDNVLKAAKEAPRIMLLPIMILAFLSIFGGFLGFGFKGMPPLERFLQSVKISPAELALSHGFTLSPEVWLSMAGAFLGVGSAAWLYTQRADRLGKPIESLTKAFYIDQIYDTLVVTPLKKLSSLIAFLFEPKLFEGSINAVTRATQKIAGGLQSIQSGEIRSYVAWMVIGAVVLIMKFVW